MVLKNSYEIFAPTHKDMSISRSLQEGIWPVEVDRKQIEQVLLNLFINSCQAMPEGGDLYLETQNVVLCDLDVKPYGVQPGRYVKISVTDTGTGMDESTRARIFEPFFTTKRPGKGTGLGLASVYGIMNNHGGFITVQSELGKGATFTLYLPASQKEAIVEEKPPEEKVLTGRETILVVDDEKSNATVMREILESLGYRVLIAGSGQEAVAVYMEKRKVVDLVLLDMIMPGMGGGRTFDALRAVDPGVKVILSSGYSAEGEARQILDRGCNGFIQKPFRIADITGMIRKVIEK
jgi:two-component system cell cycle sensor histidine kinase/response regulator CckA